MTLFPLLMQTEFEREIGEKWYQKLGERDQVHTGIHTQTTVGTGG